MYTKNFSSYENVNSQQCLHFLMDPSILQFTFAFQRHRPDLLMIIRTIKKSLNLKVKGSLNAIAKANVKPKTANANS